MRDETFPLKSWFLCPYPGRLLQLVEMIYNYPYSGARRVIENEFAILGACWRIFSHPVKASIQNTERYVLAWLRSHIYPRQTNSSFYTPQGFPNIKLENDKIKGGEWTSQAGQDGCLKSMKPPNSKRWPEKNFSERNSRKYFMNSEIGSMRWQLDYVRSVGETRWDE